MKIEELKERISELPWIYYKPVGAEHRSQYFIAKSGHLAHGDVDGKDNAQFIAHAANNFFPLLEALIKAADWMDAIEKDGIFYDGKMEIEEVLAKAKDVK